MSLLMRRALWFFLGVTLSWSAGVLMLTPSAHANWGTTALQGHADCPRGTRSCVVAGPTYKGLAFLAGSSEDLVRISGDALCDFLGMDSLIKATTVQVVPTNVIAGQAFAEAWELKTSMQIIRKDVLPPARVFSQVVCSKPEYKEFRLGFSATVAEPREFNFAPAP